MFRKRLVATYIVATAALGIVSTSDAVAQDVIDPDAEAAKTPKKPDLSGATLIVHSVT